MTPRKSGGEERGNISVPILTEVLPSVATEQREKEEEEEQEEEEEDEVVVKRVLPILGWPQCGE